ncbi:hypothetical protein CTI12_AA523440 [Artemisia annua]|uniref:OTU domain-containing protein n=1 Tax=Artemisia annua TaxID=35608 RepID=A0A2U1L774_ARTAN|nr:hypothetical protein CTI12_AA523440 [Artemisia annua]
MNLMDLLSVVKIGHGGAMAVGGGPPPRYFPYRSNLSDLVKIGQKLVKIGAWRSKAVKIGLDGGPSTPQCKSFTKHLKPRPIPVTSDEIRDEWLDMLGYVLRKVDGDGNCLMRAISHQMWFTEAHHEIIRRVVIAQFRTHSDLYRKGYTDEEYEGLIKDMSTPYKDTQLIACYAIADAFEVSIICLVTYHDSPIYVVKPSNGVESRKNLYLCISKNHADSMFLKQVTGHERYQPNEEVIKKMKQYRVFLPDDYESLGRLTDIDFD